MEKSSGAVRLPLVLDAPFSNLSNENLVTRPVGLDDEFEDARVSNIMEFMKNPINNEVV